MRNNLDKYLTAMNFHTFLELKSSIDIICQYAGYSAAALTSPVTYGEGYWNCYQCSPSNWKSNSETSYDSIIYRTTMSNIEFILGLSQKKCWWV